MRIGKNRLNTQYPVGLLGRKLTSVHSYYQWGLIDANRTLSLHKTVHSNFNPNEYGPIPSAL